MEFIWALQFLTRLPVFTRAQRETTAEDLARCMAAFPLVGAFLGLILVGTHWVTAQVFPSTVSAVLLIATLVLLTGNLHWDGWMDTADGLLSGHSGERALDIMKDSRVGANAVIWGCLGLLTEYVLLNRLLALPTFEKNAWLVAILAWSRWNAVIGTYIFPYARKTGGTAKAFTAGISAREVTISTVIAMAVSLPVLGWKTLELLGGNLIIVLALGKVAERRLGGVTGDVLGAVIIAGELIGLLIGGGWL